MTNGTNVYGDKKKNESNYQPPLTLASGGWYTYQLKEMSVADKHEHVMQLLEYFRNGYIRSDHMENKTNEQIIAETARNLDIMDVIQEYGE